MRSRLTTTLLAVGALTASALAAPAVALLCATFAIVERMERRDA